MLPSIFEESSWSPRQPPYHPRGTLLPRPYEFKRLGRVSVLPPAHAPMLDIMKHDALVPQYPAPTSMPAIPGYMPGMYDNDHVGDCTCAALANSLRATAAYKASANILIHTHYVLKLYSQWGWPKVDQGAAVTDVLASQLHGGFDVGQQVTAAALWATLSNTAADGHGIDLTEVRRVIAATGSIYLGLELAVADQAWQPGATWTDNPPVAAGSNTPGSWGGHAAILTGPFDHDTATLDTWGELVTVTWGWVASRMVEAHLLGWRQFFGTKNSFDWDALEEGTNDFTPTAAAA